MASYPEPLTFLLNRISGWSVNTARVVPQSLTSCQPGQFITFTLPENQLVDLRSLAIFGDIVGIRGAGATDRVVLPRLSTSLIDMVNVTINGTSIDSSLIGYNHLAKLMYDMTSDGRKSAMNPLHLASDYVSSDTDLPLVGRDQGSAAGGVTASPGAAISDFYDTGRNSLAFCWSDFLGFLGCGKIIDTSILGSVQISIRVAPAAICMRPAAQTHTPTYELRNLRMYVNVCDISDGLYYGSLASRLQSSPIQINFKRFLSFNAPQLTGSGSVRFSLSSQSIDAAYVLLLPTTPGINAPTTADAVAPFFRRLSRHSTSAATGFVRSYQFDMNSVQYPSFQANTTEAYYFALNTFRMMNDKAHNALSTLTLDTWHEDLAAFTYRWSYGTGTDWVSGIDSRGMSLSASIAFLCQGSLDALPLVIVESTATLNIGQFRSVNLVV